MQWLSVAVLCLALLDRSSTAQADVVSASAAHTYCIVGGGPAGLQLGHFFKHAGRDYVIFDKSQHAGSFFKIMPRHRRLNSLNKRFVREGRSAEFAFRHDWNSLIDVRPEAERTPPMTTRSEELYPHADVLVQYLIEFAEEQRQSIKYGAEVTNVKKDGTGFIITSSSNAAGGGKANVTETTKCQEVIMATGHWKPKLATLVVDGAEHTEGYEDLPETGHAYAGKTVVILGIGNAAMTTVQALIPFTAEAHVFARGREMPASQLGANNVRLAYQTHYAGDVRTASMTVLDTYLLKSLDTFDYNNLNGAQRMVVLPCLGGRRCLWEGLKEDCMDSECKKGHMAGVQGLNYKLPMFNLRERSPELVAVKKLLNQHAPGGDRKKDNQWEIEHSPLIPEGLEDNGPDLIIKREEEASKKEREEEGIDTDLYEDSKGNNMVELSVASSLLRQKPALLDALALLRIEYSGHNIRFPIDHMIRCFGWLVDRHMFDPSTPVRTVQKGKYPAIADDFSALGVPGVYYAGTLTHSLDYRKSGGGDIHGFRHTVRALFRSLEEKNFGVEWPHTKVPLNLIRDPAPPKAVVNVLADMLLRRINEASGPYAMFETMGDMVVLRQTADLRKEAKKSGAFAGSWNAFHLEDVPLATFHKRFESSARLIWTFKYGKDFTSTLDVGKQRLNTTRASMFNAHKSLYFHPFIEFYKAGQKESSVRISIMEDTYTTWHSPRVYSPVARFLSKALAAATGNQKWTEEGSFDDESADDNDSLV